MNRLDAASLGKSRKDGGLDIDDLREIVANRGFTNVSTMTRDKLIEILSSRKAGSGPNGETIIRKSLDFGNLAEDEHIRPIHKTYADITNDGWKTPINS